MVSGFERIQSVEFSKTYQGYVVKEMEYVEPSLPKVQRNLQKVQSFEKSGENEHLKWHAPDPAPVDLTEGEEHVPAVNTDELFGGSSSAQFGEFMTHELRLKRKAAEKAFEVAKEKDRTITRLEELRFLALSTKDLSDDDAYYINLQKQAIKDKLKLQMPRPSNNNDYNNDDDDETEDEE
ncbi:hypothetical protein Tco_0903819 [Tanacetum coccineum]